MTLIKVGDTVTNQTIHDDDFEGYIVDAIDYENNIATITLLSDNPKTVQAQYFGTVLKYMYSEYGVMCLQEKKAAIRDIQSAKLQIKIAEILNFFNPQDGTVSAEYKLNQMKITDIEDIHNALSQYPVKR